MANPKVEKLKDFALRYGDKFAVALASVVFVLCLAMAFRRPTIDIQPEQIKKYAEASEANISRRQEPDEILKVLVEQGLKDSNFAKEAEDSAKILLVADDYQPAREWVTPEPGAGLIRETPKLIAPANVYAYPGRGGALVFALDSEGNRILEAEKKDVAPKSAPARRRRRRGRSGGAGGMMGGMGMGGMMGGAAGKASGKSQAELEKAAKADEDRRRRIMQARLAGNDEAVAEEEAKDEADKGPPPKEITQGLRWVAVTGTLDHGQILANYREALKNPAVAQPYYSRLDVQRQELQADGSWGEWEDVSLKRNRAILDNLPETDEELAPVNVLPKELVAPLPFLKAGLWEKVHVNSLVPKEKKEVAPAIVPGGEGGMMGMMGRGGSMGGRGGMMGGMGMNSDMMGSMMGGRGGMMGSMMGGRGGMMGGMGMDGDMMGGMMGGGMGMGGSTGGVDALSNYWKSEEKKVMIRALDFTAEPDGSYQYRLRVVVVNPNYKRDDVAHGHDNKSKELFGPWSEASNEVHMPSDVSAYAMGVLPAGAKSDMKVQFQVIRFNPEDGVTVPSTFEASPGEIIGEPVRRDVPVSDGTGKKTKLIDFTTRQIVLDVDGGWQAMPTGLPGGGLARPATALLLRPDGGVMVREEADDRLDEVRKDIDSNYKRELKESDKERENGMGSGYGGMMGGMGGMMGGMMR